MLVKMHAPSQQFGFVEIEGTVDDIPEMERLYNKYSENKLDFKGSFKKFDTFTGETILYDEASHRYTDLEGNKLISGSEYAKNIIGEFNTDLLSGKVSKKYGVEKEIVQKMWEASGNISATFGTALHLAMEQWFLHRDFGTEKGYHLPKPDYLKKAVESFPLKDLPFVYPEVFVSDVANKMVGQVDALVFVGRDDIKEYDILDYKSDSDVSKNIKKHRIQLNFYRKILENKGFKIRKMSIWNYINEWSEHKIDIIEI